MKIADLIGGKVVAISGNQTDEFKITIEKDGKEYIAEIGSRCGCGVSVGEITQR